MLFKLGIMAALGYAVLAAILFVFQPRFVYYPDTGRNIIGTPKDHGLDYESVKIETDKIEMIEMNEKGIAGYRYTLNRTSATQTMLAIDVLIKNNPIFKLGFSLVYKAGMRKKVQQFFEKLRNFIRAENFKEAV